MASGAGRRITNVSRRAGVGAAGGGGGGGDRSRDDKTRVSSSASPDPDASAAAAIASSVNAGDSPLGERDRRIADSRVASAVAATASASTGSTDARPSSPIGPVEKLGDDLTRHAASSAAPASSSAVATVHAYP